MQIQQRKDNEKAGEVLFGDSYSAALLRTYAFLNCPLEEKVGERFKKILQDEVISQAHHSLCRFSLITKAVITDVPQLADEALNGLIDYYDERGRTPVLCLPTVLGLLGALQCLDEGEFSTFQTDQLVCKLLKRFSFGGTEFSMSSDESVMKNQKGLLSDAVALFVKGLGRVGNKGRRIAHVMELLFEINHEISSGKPLSNFGKVLVDELSYKLYGTISTEGRVKALVLLHQDLVKAS